MTRLLLISFILLFTSVNCKSNNSTDRKLPDNNFKNDEPRITDITLKNSTPQENLIESGPIVGAVTENSATFLVKPVNSSSVRIQLSEDSSFTEPFYTEEINTDQNNFNFTKIQISNLSPGVKYFYRAVIDGAVTDRIHSFKTFSAEKNYNFSFGFGSCQQGYGATSPDIFPVIAEDSLRFFIQTGDWTYPDFSDLGRGYNQSMDKLEESYRERYDYSYPFNSGVLSMMPVSYLYDDHDFAGNDADGTNAYKLNSVKAYSMFFPHYELDNPDNGIWQKFRFGDVEFFLPDLRTQRSANADAIDAEGKFNPPAGHSILNGFTIDGEDQKTWLENSLKNSDAKWKVIISTVIFNPRYSEALKNEQLGIMFPKVQKGIIDKWAGYPEDTEFLIDIIKNNDIKNVIMVSGDSHSSYIDDGANSVLPEISSSNLDTKNSKLGLLTQLAGYNIWNQGSYNDDGHAYGRVSFYFGDEEYALLEVIDQTGKVVLSYRLDKK
ncbi:MAG TPA: alkaline phosphatase D family protein [Ignavibacteria bacterium]|nr:alkaline phosphatase D family protein [Ignavibacteria bacterium]